MVVPKFLASIATIVAIATLPRSHALSVVKNYQDPNGDTLLSMDMDVQSGSIVISKMVNYKNVVRLTNDLELEDVVPKEFNFPHVDNIVINKDQNSVVLCSSFEGKCKVHSLKNVTKVLYSNPFLLVPKSVQYTKSNSVVFLTSAKTLFIANNFNKDSEYNKMVPILSYRSSVNLALWLDSSQGYYAKYVQSNHKALPRGYSVEYIYAFVHKNYVYMVSRISDADSPSPRTGIARVCLDDKFLSSYVEIPVTCAGKKLHSAKAAHYDEVGEKLFVSFITVLHDVDMSAVCMFELRDINKMMDNTVRDCFRGLGIHGPAHLHDTNRCKYQVRI